MSPTTASAGSSASAFEIESGLRFMEGEMNRKAGKINDARGNFESAIALNNEHIEAHYALSKMKKYKPTDPQFAMMEHMRKSVETRPVEIQMRYWFAYGKMFDDIGNYREAMVAWHKANGLKWEILRKGSIPPNTVSRNENELMARITNFFSPKMFVDMPEKKYPVTPIFIVGMPRSGSTLIEQILASHSKCFAVGESLGMMQTIVDAMPERQFSNFPRILESIGESHFQNMGYQYLQKVMTGMPEGTEYIVDKMPDNFWYLGAIKRMFPNAKFIHSVRDAMDVHLSCYGQFFDANHIEYSYNLEMMARRYIRYETLMAFWRTCLPAKSITDVIYELMVTDLELYGRVMMDSLGIEWEEGCLDFHKNTRTVITASEVQVKTPLYTSSVGRWENYFNQFEGIAKMIDEARAAMPLKERYWKEQFEAKENPTHWG